MKCLCCERDFIDILKHLKKSLKCQTNYNMSDLIKERQMIRLRKQRESMKTLYEHKRENILKKKKTTLWN